MAVSIPAAHLHGFAAETGLRLDPAGKDACIGMQAICSGWSE